MRGDEGVPAGAKLVSRRERQLSRARLADGEGDAAAPVEVEELVRARPVDRRGPDDERPHLARPHAQGVLRVCALWVAPGEQLDEAPRRAQKLACHLSGDVPLVAVAHRATADAGYGGHEGQRDEE